MQPLLRVLLVSALAVTASSCTDEPQIAGISDGALALGIERFDLHQEPSRLTIDGVDASGKIVAHLDLRLGAFTMTSDGDAPREVYGRQMTIDIGTTHLVHESEGTLVLNLPLAHRDARTQGFLLDPQVTTPLATRGIRFDRTKALAPAELASTIEQPYSCFSYNTYPQIRVSATHSGCGSTSTGSATEWNNDLNNSSSTGEYRCCNAGAGVSATANERACYGWSQGNATPCGASGPAGCAVCWSQSGVSSCYARDVWFPTGELGPDWGSQIDFCM